MCSVGEGDVLDISFYVNGELQILNIPRAKYNVYQLLKTDDDYTIQYIKDLISAKVLPVDNLISLQRLDENEITEVYEDNPENGEASEPENVKSIWGHDETILLICIVESRYDELHHTSKRKHVWTHISEDLKKSNVMFSSVQCKTKWSNLIRSYKSCVDNYEKHGRGPLKFQYFDQMAKVIDNKLNASSPQHVLKDRINHKSAPSISISNKDSENEQELNTDTIAIASSTATKKTYKKKNYMCEYVKIKSEYYKHKKEEQKRKNDLWEKKLLLQERTVNALEELVRLKKNEYNNKHI